MNYWKFQGRNITSTPPDTWGFVYIITNILNNKKYIGQKSFYSVKSNPKTKNKKSIVESNWENYYGSNKILKADVKKHGVDYFKREILMFCTCKSDLNYYEMKYQVVNEVLESDEWYNEWINYKGRGPKRPWQCV